MEKNKILMIVIIVLLVVLLGALGFLGLTFAKYLKGSGQEAEASTASAGPVVALTPEQIELVPLSKPISTNLRTDSDNKTHIASVNLSIGVDNTDKKQSPEMIEMMTSKESIIRDICLNTIRSKSIEELRRQDGPDVLRSEILLKLQEEFQSNLIYQVYVSDIYLE